MRNIFILFIFLGLIVGCKNRDTQLDGKVELTLLNDSIVFSGTDGHYKYEGDLERGANIVRYKITNNSNEKLLFFPVNAQQLYNSCLTFDIVDNKGKSVKKGDGISFIAKDTCWSCDLAVQNKKSDMYSKIFNGKFKGQDLWCYMAYVRDKVIISPGESWEFHALASFPVEYFNGSFIRYDLKEDSYYTLALNYKLDRQLSEKIPDFEKENLKRNNIRIFEGEFTSNKVKLVHVATP
ncbi:hypothetical protein V1389_16800 [Flavobacterium rakeshii]|uniref:hypothetical protein n=1 Tax=Flavobacterium rakeshii TaxID=1038845 RepID=UPI002E7C39E1|nr:hypothetical protein [Flavobacterium rakeshii]MEE1900010.1 hypothetical protein [Flavobacterium rakeshii]